jgi:hypothetical protein
MAGLRRSEELRGLDRLRTTGCLSLDADECVTPPLAAALQETLSTTPGAAGYRVARVTQHLGRWSPDHRLVSDFQLRLYDRRRATWTGRYVHEGVQVDGNVGRLPGELQHFPYRDIAEHSRHESTPTRLTPPVSCFEARQTQPGLTECALHPPAWHFSGTTSGAGGFRDAATAGFNHPSAMERVLLLVPQNQTKLWELQTPDSQHLSTLGFMFSPLIDTGTERGAAGQSQVLLTVNGTASVKPVIEAALVAHPDGEYAAAARL